MQKDLSGSLQGRLFTFVFFLPNVTSIASVLQSSVWRGGRWNKAGQEAVSGLCGKQELRIKHLGRDPGAIPLWSCRAGRLALRDSTEVGSGNWHLVLQAEQRGSPAVSPLAQTSGRQDRDKQLRARERLHPITAGWDRDPSLSLSRAPESLCSGNKGFGVAPKGGLSRIPHQAGPAAGSWSRQKQ